MDLKISIITPSFNSGKYIEDAINSVLDQSYSNYEHIIVDAGSTDNTHEILRRYPHLKWISEKDKGQSDAMNKGFKMATGDIIGYLNADDYYYPNIFATIIKYFDNGAFFVQGKIKVEENGKSYINDAKTSFHEIIRHWNPQAFCVNPVGYFYRKEVQQKIGGFDINNHYSMDLQFLIGAAKHFSFTKVKEDLILGVFRYNDQTKTSNNQSDINLWSPKTFWYIEEYIQDLSEEKKQDYYHDRKVGYEMRKEWQRQANPGSSNMIKKIENKIKSIFKSYA